MAVCPRERMIANFVGPIRALHNVLSLVPAVSLNYFQCFVTRLQIACSPAGSRKNANCILADAHQTACKHRPACAATVRSICAIAVGQLGSQRVSPPLGLFPLAVSCFTSARYPATVRSTLFSRPPTVNQVCAFDSARVQEHRERNGCCPPSCVLMVLD